ncbi:MAG: DegT/DnrJ/EryC1/StrS family aminotransferase [Enhydrobacter sp.]|nr:MAG: DegT/DnrJ/EryC1/StrS family aminotransferase [Enhydrobacter sp.]
MPFFDFKAVFAEDPDGFTDVFRSTLAEGGIILQKAVDQFEQELAAYLNCRHVVGTSDCTNAMMLGLRAAGLGPEDEVIICSHTFIATAQAVHFAGATPVPVEVGADRMIDPDAIESAVTPRTRAVMVTQLNGRVCDMDRIAAIAGKRGLIVVEDSAQALGATFRGRKAGTFGAFGAFSFYPSKLLGCFGDGGVLTTDDDGIAERVYHMRNHGANRQKQLDRTSTLWATNSRLDNVQAALLSYKLPKFPATVARRRRIARTYHAAFEELPDFGLPPGPDVDGPHFDVFQNYEIDVGDRDGLRAYLQQVGVGTIIQWGGIAIHQLRALGFRQELDRTDRFFARCMLLPMNQYLSDKDVLQVSSSVRAYYGLPPWKDMAAEGEGDWRAGGHAD